MGSHESPSVLPDAPYSVETHVGRLIEGRVFRLSAAEDVDEYIGVLANAVEALPHGSTGVLIADHRPAEIYPQPVTDRLVQMFQVMNKRLERVAIVTGVEKATLYMQLRRIVRAAHYDARQVFQDTPPALQHLSAALTPEELERAREFLDDFAPA
jgi:hypothetical protein